MLFRITPYITPIDEHFPSKVFVARVSGVKEGLMSAAIMVRHIIIIIIIRSKNSPSPFFPTSPHKFGHNSAILGCIEKWFAPSCSSRDSASGNISLIDIFKMADDKKTEFNLNVHVIFV